MAEITQLTGVIGYPVSKNLSAFMHNAGFKKLNLDYRYLLLEVKPDKLKDAILGIRAMNFKGFNITVPYKEKIIPLIDDITKAAQEIGAVNTVWKDKEGKLIGDNTDGKGFLRALKNEKNIELKGKKVFLLGAGGAAKAIAITLAKEEISELYIADLDTKKANNLVENIKDFNKAIKTKALDGAEHSDIKDVVNNVDIFVNATPVGMYNNPDNIPVPIEVLNPNLLVYDIINNPYKTKFIQLAEQLGADTLNGLPMLSYQGLEGFKRWTGEKIPVEVFKEAALKEVEMYSFVDNNH
ncbi:MAG: shikimate dehydrogenase [Bacillota bacterium]